MTLFGAIRCHVRSDPGGISFPGPLILVESAGSGANKRRMTAYLPKVWRVRPDPGQISVPRRLISDESAGSGQISVPEPPICRLFARLLTACALPHVGRAPKSVRFLSTLASLRDYLLIYFSK